MDANIRGFRHCVLFPTTCLPIFRYLCYKLAAMRETRHRAFLGLGALLATVATTLTTMSLAQPTGANWPLFQTKLTADPAPVVFGDTLFVYTSHDSWPEDIVDPEEGSSAGFFMYDWLLWTTTDMANWTEHASPASLRDFSWRTRDNGAWAIQTVERGGKYYLYAPLHGHGIGVLTGDTPYGPFRDTLQGPLVWQKEHWEDIDPTVYVDHDGQAYLYWGNPHTYAVRLNEDMVSWRDPILKWDMRRDHYQEGPWLFARGGKYYLSYATTCCPEAIGYSMAPGPLGPWAGQGYIMRPTDRDRGNHPGIVEYKGHWYVFGQNYDLMHLETQEHHEQRSVSATELTFNADGTIAEVPYWLDQQPLKQLEWLNPYRRVEAETMAWGYGLRSGRMGMKETYVVSEMQPSTGPVGMYVTNIDNGEYIRLRGVDFAQGAKSYEITASATGSCRLTLRLDKPDGKVVGTLSISGTGSLDTYRSFSATVKGAKGVHDLYLCFDRAEGEVRLDWWRFWGTVVSR